MTTLTPGQVFTPRSSDVNPAMYVARSELESALVNGLEGAKHLVLHGESGSGKSWLYKRVFEAQVVDYEVVNLADASRFGSISAALRNTVARGGVSAKTGFTESKSATFDALLVKGDLVHAASYETAQVDPFEQCLRSLRERAGTKRALLVLDNLESVFSQDERKKELADLITLVDDANYARYKIKFLIVGVPAGLQQYFYETPNMRTVGNRLRELPEVFRFNEQQAHAFIKRGLVEQLGYLSDNSPLLAEIAEHVLWVSGGIPQRLHEYGLLLAELGRADGGAVKSSHLKQADARWLQESGYQAYSVVESAMNEKATRAQRRNQVLYAIGQLTTAAFRATEVEPVVRSLFPKSTQGVGLNVPQLVADLEARANPIIRRSPKGDTHVFCDPVYRMALRAMLSVDAHEQVQKKEISDLFGGDP